MYMFKDTSNSVNKPHIDRILPIKTLTKSRSIIHGVSKKEFTIQSMPIFMSFEKIKVEVEVLDIPV